MSIATHEDDALDLATILQAARLRLTSPVAVWETVVVLARRYMFSVESARDRVDAICGLYEIRLVDIGERELELALQAFAQFGTGRHPAVLNLGDCFAYACTKAHRAELLFKGDDFTKTDVRAAHR